VRSLSDEQFGHELKMAIAEDLCRIAHRTPQLLRPFVEPLIGAMTTICRQYDGRFAQRPAEKDVLASLQRRGDLAALNALLRRISDAIVDAGGDDLDDILGVLSELIANTPTDVAATFKGQLLALIGGIGKRYESARAALIPLIFPHMVDPLSPLVRASAAQACADLVERRRAILPDDMLTVLAAMLADEYVAPMHSAVRVFRVAVVPDERLALSIATRLRGAYTAYRRDAGSWHDLLRNTVSALRNLAGQHTVLVPYVAEVLLDGAYHEDRDLAKECLEQLGRFAERHAAYQEQYIACLASYYRRFRLVMETLGGAQSLEGEQDHEFETLYSLPPAVVRGQTDLLAEMAHVQEVLRNRVQISLVLATVGVPGRAADLYESCACVGRLPRPDNSRVLIRRRADRRGASRPGPELRRPALLAYGSPARPGAAQGAAGRSPGGGAPC
jgi:hypothetical protein